MFDAKMEIELMSLPLKKKVPNRRLPKLELVTVKWSIWLSNGADQGNGATSGKWSMSW